MSLEPTTSARVILETTKGSIEIELYAKETPIASRWFLNSCLNDYFTGQSFDRVVKDFLMQSKSTLDGSFPDEVNHRLKFDKKGVVASCGDGGFFISLNPSPELNGKQTVIGKVVGDSFYTIVRINESELDGETPLYPTKIVSAQVVEGYFEDLKKSEVVEEKVVVRPKKKMRLSYDDESEAEQEQEVKMVSAHEILKDKRLRNVEERKEVEKRGKEKEEEPERSEKPERPEILAKEKPVPEPIDSQNLNSAEPEKSRLQKPEKSDQKPFNRLQTQRPDRELRELQTKKMLEDFKKGQSDSEDEFDIQSLRSHKLTF